MASDTYEEITRPSGLLIGRRRPKAVAPAIRTANADAAVFAPSLFSSAPAAVAAPARTRTRKSQHTYPLSLRLLGYGGYGIAMAAGYAVVGVGGLVRVVAPYAWPPLRMAIKAALTVGTVGLAVNFVSPGIYDRITNKIGTTTSDALYDFNKQKLLMTANKADSTALVQNVLPPSIDATSDPDGDLQDLLQGITGDQLRALQVQTNLLSLDASRNAATEAAGGPTGWFRDMMLQAMGHYAAEGAYDSLKGMKVDDRDIPGFVKPAPLEIFRLQKLSQLENIAALDILSTDDPQQTLLLSNGQKIPLFDLLERRLAKKSQTRAAFGEDDTVQVLAVLRHVRRVREDYRAQLQGMTDDERRTFARKEAVQIVDEIVPKTQVDPAVAVGAMQRMSPTLFDGSAGGTLSTMDAIALASKITGNGAALLTSVEMHESGGQKAVRSATGPTGLFQFSGDTWIMTLYKHADEMLAGFEANLPCDSHEVVTLRKILPLAQEIWPLKQRRISLESQLKNGHLNSQQQARLETALAITSSKLHRLETGDSYATLMTARMNAMINATAGGFYINDNRADIKTALTAMGSADGLALFDREKDNFRVFITANMTGPGSANGATNRASAGMANLFASGFSASFSDVLPSGTTGPNRELGRYGNTQAYFHYLNKFAYSAGEVNALIARYGHSLDLAKACRPRSASANAAGSSMGLGFGSNG